MESCLGKTIISGGMGFVLGGAFGLFMSSVCYSRADPSPASLFPHNFLSNMPDRERARTTDEEVV